MFFRQYKKKNLKSNQIKGSVVTNEQCFRMPLMVKGRLNVTNQSVNQYKKGAQRMTSLKAGLLVAGLSWIFTIHDDQGHTKVI